MTRSEDGTVEVVTMEIAIQLTPEQFERLTTSTDTITVEFEAQE